MRGAKLTASLKRKLSKVYYDIKNPAGYGSARRLKRAFPSVSLSVINQWLQSQPTYTRHRYRRLRYKTNKIYAIGINDSWQADLLDLPALKKFNNNYRYVLVVIDVLSRYLFAVPIKNKTTGEIIKAFREIFKSRVPLKIFSDRGREFNSRAFKKFLKSRGVNIYFSSSQFKASLAERVIRTIKEQIYRVITRTGNKNYLKYLPSIISAYNNRIHSTIGVAPAKVNVWNESAVWDRLYGHSQGKREKNLPLTVGDKVRLAIAEEAFRKTYKGTFTEEIFVVDQVIRREPPVYRIKDLKGELIEGTFYANELQKVIEPED